MVWLSDKKWEYDSCGNKFVCHDFKLHSDGSWLGKEILLTTVRHCHEIMFDFNARTEKNMKYHWTRSCNPIKYTKSDIFHISRLKTCMTDIRQQTWNPKSQNKHRLYRCLSTHQLIKIIFGQSYVEYYQTPLFVTLMATNGRCIIIIALIYGQEYR